MTRPAYERSLDPAARLDPDAAPLADDQLQEAEFRAAAAFGCIQRARGLDGKRALAAWDALTDDEGGRWMLCAAEAAEADTHVRGGLCWYAADKDLVTVDPKKLVRMWVRLPESERALYYAADQAADQAAVYWVHNWRARMTTDNLGADA